VVSWVNVIEVYHLVAHDQGSVVADELLSDLRAVF
jgi:hypothetical protein